MEEEEDTNLKVVVRVRPVNKSKEISTVCVQTIDDFTLIFDPTTSKKQILHDSNQAVGKFSKFSLPKKNLTFAFDKVFSTNSSQEEVFEAVGIPIVEHLVCSGNDCCVFAYGATAAGKTTTMMGNEEIGDGLIISTFQELWKEIDHSCTKIRASYVEIYNEKIYDLFAGKAELPIRCDRAGRDKLCGAKWLVPGSANDLVSTLRKANSARRQRETTQNILSSRSHAVFLLQILTTLDHGSSNCATLTLVDLAGSERAQANENAKDLMKESSVINQSLLALAKCIQGLVKKQEHVNFRDSVMTRILRDSLTNTSTLTFMIANISPSVSSYHETFNTLHYANECKKIRPTPSAIGNHEEVLIQRITELKNEIARKNHIWMEIRTRNNSDISQDCEKLLYSIITSKRWNYVLKQFVANYESFDLEMEQLRQLALEKYTIRFKYNLNQLKASTFAECFLQNSSPDLFEIRVKESHQNELMHVLEEYDMKICAKTNQLVEKVIHKYLNPEESAVILSNEEISRLLLKRYIFNNIHPQLSSRHKFLKELPDIIKPCFPQQVQFEFKSAIQAAADKWVKYDFSTETENMQ